MVLGCVWSLVQDSQFCDCFASACMNRAELVAGGCVSGGAVTESLSSDSETENLPLYRGRIY